MNLCSLASIVAYAASLISSEFLWTNSSACLFVCKSAPCILRNSALRASLSGEGGAVVRPAGTKFALLGVVATGPIGIGCVVGGGASGVGPWCGNGAMLLGLEPGCAVLELLGVACC